MKKIKFNIEINAPAEKVYSAMIDKEYGQEWISVFSPNSYFKGSWNKGEKIVFISPDENGALHGMICTIKENIPNKQLFIQPLGIIENGIEVTEGKKIEGLDQAYEKYLFNQKGDMTELNIEAIVYDELEEYFNETWPQALNKIKSICENN